MIRKFDLNHFASTNLNQLYASDFDFEMTIVWFVTLVGIWPFPFSNTGQMWMFDVNERYGVFFCCVVGIVIHK